MYEYQSKRIKNYFELKDVCRKATSYFVGSFMVEIIMRRSEWENPATKTAFVKDFCREYSCDTDQRSEERIRNRINCVIRIIESEMVEDALEYVLNANDSKMDIPEAKENARITLEWIQTGKLKYRKDEK